MILLRFLPVNSLSLMAVEAQRRGQVSGTSANLILLPLPGGECLIHSRRAQEGYQGWTELLPQEGREMRVGVNLLR